MSLYEIAGLLGVAFYLGSYLALQLNALEGSGYAYAGLNLIAAALVLISLAESFNLSSALIQTSWIAISVVGMIRFYLLTRTISFTAEERAFLEAKFLQMSAIDARRFLSAGEWWSGEPGVALSRQGEVIGQLHYLADGSARVTLGDRQVGQVNAQSFVGELTCFTGDPASATVVLENPARLFSIDTNVLRAQCARYPDLRLHVENSMKLDTHDKLLAANRRLSEPG